MAAVRGRGREGVARGERWGPEGEEGRAAGVEV
jgi:hypothetical protein